MDVTESVVEDVSESNITSSNQVNGVDDEEPEAAVTILTNKPLVYDYDDTAADEWPQESDSVQESSENKTDGNTSVWTKQETAHSDTDNTTLPADIDNESAEHIINANEEIVVALGGDEEFVIVEEETANLELNDAPKVETEEPVLSNEWTKEAEKDESETVSHQETIVENDQFETVVILKDEPSTTKEVNENEGSNSQNLHSALVDDWDVEDVSESQEDDKKKQELNKSVNPESEKASSTETQNGVAQKRNPPKQRLFLANRYLSRQEAVKEILKNKPTPLRSIIPKKDLILAMELAKHSTTGVGVELDEPNDILQILESDQVGDWREALPPTSVKHGNDTEIMREVNSVQSPVTNAKPKGKKVVQPSQAKAAVERRRIERMIERKLALEQLAKEFKTSKRKRSEVRTLAVAAEDLERALSATPVLAGKRKRRPCYQPEEKPKEDDSDVIETKPSAIIKTYVPKPRSSDSLSEVETALETIAIVNRHLNVDVQPGEVSKQTEESKVNEGEKANDKVKKKRVRELQQLLGDEGAVRMIYDAAQKDEGVSTPMFKKTKKGLLQKTKFVENAVLRASGVSEKSLRGKRLNVSSEDKSPEDTLFPPATPGSAQTAGRSRKKPKPAEASRILYRHSSSESFDGSEGLRRSVSEIAGLDMSPERAPVKAYGTPQRKSTRPRKVSSKLSAYVAEPVSQKKKEKKGDEQRVSADTENKQQPSVESIVDQPEVNPPPKVKFLK